jgi:HAD superfamily hydrolase (TIGR01484 family)
MHANPDTGELSRPISGPAVTSPPTHRPLKPWSACPATDLRAVAGVLTDIDDTLTTDGAITADALGALQALRAAGLPVMAITGRPMGWSEPFAREWPVDAIVAENGAVALFTPGPGAPLAVEYAQDEATRARHARRLREVAARVLREVPGSRLARDSAGRVTDIAIDHSEFAQLPADQIERVLALVRAEGLTASVSSIHVNAWFGAHDKLSGARWIVRRLLGRDLDAERGRWVFVGDSTNDQLLFGHFPLSVGVANVMRFERQLAVWPRYIAQGERGAGFAEVADAILRARA